MCNMSTKFKEHCAVVGEELANVCDSLNDMDVMVNPMVVLPPEVALHICTFLEPVDLMQLWEVNTFWRQIVSDASLWKSVTLVVTGYGSYDGEEDPTDSRSLDIFMSIKVLRRAPCLGSVLFHGVQDLRPKQMEALLETKAEVRVLENIAYHEEIEVWMYQVIEHLSPHLEEVTVNHPSYEFLNILNSLPNLSRLSVYGGGIHIYADTEPVVCAPVGRLKEFSDLGFMTLPTHALTSIIKSHCHTLEMITVSDSSFFQDGLSKFLKAILGDCKFPALKKLFIGDWCIDAQDLDATLEPFLE